jgi:hypothetical protein
MSCWFLLVVFLSLQVIFLLVLPNSIGDGSNMMRYMNYGLDSTNGQQRPVKADNIGKPTIDLPAGSDLCLQYIRAFD